MLKHAIKQVVHKCDRCFESFDDKRALERHTKIHKKEAKKYRCFYCSKKFSKSSSLLKHEKKHNQEDSSESEKEEIIFKSKTNSKPAIANSKVSVAASPDKSIASAKENPAELKEDSAHWKKHNQDDSSASGKVEIISKSKTKSKNSTANSKVTVAASLDKPIAFVKENSVELKEDSPISPAHWKKPDQDDSSTSEKEEIILISKTKSKPAILNSKVSTVSLASIKENSVELKEDSPVIVINSPEQLEENLFAPQQELPLSFIEVPSVSSMEKSYMLEDTKEFDLSKTSPQTYKEKSPTPPNIEQSSTHWKKKKMSSQNVWSPAREAIESKSFSFLGKKIYDRNQTVSSELALNLSKKPGGDGNY
ncbi:uncharacterized protein [Parasteatoda tepidariorum]|uniref:uncharacterized protein n=1 Tax=Parasteatoda tepidariorum TaxID=114398 RepID=UPI00077FBE3B|nr:histone-lysine N-methyltransferase PRDM16 [Parasteatoda tepidariorum]